MIRDRRCRGVWSVLVVWLCTCAAQAHDPRPLIVELGALPATDPIVTWYVPSSVPPGRQPRVSLGEECRPAGPERERWTREAAVMHQSFRCQDSLFPAIALDYPRGNPSLATVVKWRVGADAHQVFLSPDVVHFQVPTKAPPPRALAFLALGTRHIFEGWDHLLFLILLLIISRTRRRTVLAVTGFTLGHSVTLATSALGYIGPNPVAVEGLIALSILWLAAEILRPTRDTWTWRRPGLMACAFGLLHGLGFAGVLTEIGLPEGQRFEALLAFNIGVEIGQVAFVLLAALVARELSQWRSRQRLALKGETVVASISGVVAGYWLIERVSPHVV